MYACVYAIQSITEVYVCVLQCFSFLKGLDLRLNPVMRTEPDYRLFVIHMLVHLRKLGL